MFVHTVRKYNLPPLRYLFDISGHNPSDANWMLRVCIITKTADVLDVITNNHQGRGMI